MTTSSGRVAVRLVGGPTVLIELGGLRLLTDPTFDPPGDHPVGSRVLAKTRGPAVPAVDVAVLFAGAARAPLLDAYLTLTSDQAAQAARILGARAVIPAHTEGWGHFTQGPETIAPAFARHGAAGELVLLAPGESATVDL